MVVGSCIYCWNPRPPHEDSTLNATSFINLLYLGRMFMGRIFKQLHSEDRIAISTLLRAGHNKESIAKQLGFHRATIYREVARNKSVRLGYVPIIAERKSKARCGRPCKLAKDDKLREHVLAKLQQSWSPAQIAGRLKYENQGRSIICHETIYAYLYSDVGIRNQYYQHLRRKRFYRYPKISRQNRIKIPHRVSIHERPEAVDLRQEFGHWEADLMLFSRPTKTYLITLRGRQSRYLIAVKSPSKHATITSENILKAVSTIDKKYIKSLTFDNGHEFAKHEALAKKLQAKTYFCDPYKSYQKGSIENGNKQLREWFARDCYIETISQYHIHYRTQLINQRPMKCLNYLTPAEVFYANVRPSNKTKINLSRQAKALFN